MAGETTELKIPFPEESDNINEGATKIKALAERVDLLLRKQLTKVLEVAKLKVTETVELPKGFALTETENKYSTVTREASTEYEESATRPVQIILSVVASQSLKVTVGGVALPIVGAGGASQFFPITFTVNPGEKWKWTANEIHLHECAVKIL